MKNKIIWVLGLLFIVLIFVIVYDTFFRVKLDNSNIRFIDELEIEVYSRTFVSDFVESIDGKILDDKYIDTSSLGNKEILFLYETSDGRKRMGSVIVEVVDSQEPSIFISSSYTIVQGSNDFSSNMLMSVDNYDSRPKREIIGNYSISKIGEYKLTYRVSDSSGNVSEKDFVLNVVDSIKSNNNSGSSKSYTDFDDIVKKHKNENTMIGIDVSKWQRNIDFKKVALASCEFVMIRVGYQDGIGGESILDPFFEQNIRNALENNLKVGIYYYSHAKNAMEAKEQALWVIDKLSSYEIDLPVVFDWENWSKFNLYEVSLYDINVIADTFMDILKKNNYNYMLYGSKYYLNNIWDVFSKNIWLAHYTKETDYDKDYMMWQMCDNGIIDGIDGYVDIDILYL